jgi:hypothetical protein
MSAQVVELALRNDAGTVLHNFPLPKNRLDAMAAPTTGDDDADGYVGGSLWIDRTADKAYVCTDNATGAAIWQEIGAGGAAVSSAGPNVGSSAAAVSGSGDNAWTNPGNATASDNSYATCVMDDGESSDYLDVTGFGFSLPSGAAPIGYKVEVEAKATSGNTVYPLLVRLLSGGSPTGDDKGLVTGSLPTTDAYQSFGGDSDKWGTSLAGSLVNASDFGVRVQFFSGVGTHTVSVDSVRITVWYTTAGAGAPDSADYLVKTANAGLSAERVVTDTSTVAWDWATAGQAKAAVVDNSLVAGKLHATATDKLFGRSSASAGAGEEIACTAAGRALIDDADAAAQRTTLGLGTAATVNTDNDSALAANSATLVPTQQAVKGYVDNLVTGLAWKASVRAATTAAGTLASSFENGDSIDGVTLATGDRILIKNQAAGAENGIYVVNASGAPTRAVDANAGAELVNATVLVSEGTTNADTVWTCTNNATPTLGTTALTFAQVAGAGTYTADGTSLTLSGNQFARAALTGDVTASAGSSATTIASNAATNAKLADMANATIKGRKTAGTGDPEDCTLSDVLDFIGSAAGGDILVRGGGAWVRLPAGTSGQFLQTLGAGVVPAWASGGAPVDVQIFEAGTTTWAKPGGGQTFGRAIVIGGGGGGGSGRRGATSTARAGGTGGSGGGYAEMDFRLADAGSTETVVVGGGGAGGTAVTADSTNGNVGGAGGDSTFGTAGNDIYLKAFGGAAGAGGTALTVSGSSGGAGQLNGGASGGVTITAPPNGSNGSAGGATGASGKATGGGGGGGSLASTNGAGSGGVGGAAGDGQAGGSSGTIGVAGGAGKSVTAKRFMGGAGGGGGGAHASTAAGAGGAGGKYGGGGGGGGASVNGQTSGAGGAGSAGVVIVICW